MAHAKAVIGATHYATTIDASGHRIVADEPPGNGGTDTGPAPYDLLLASLAACTCPPVSRIILSVSRAPASSISQPITVAPSAAKMRAAARP